jgi:hypothetical protein
MPKNDGGPAFPLSARPGLSLNSGHGMSLHDFHTSTAMQIWLKILSTNTEFVNKDEDATPEEIAREAVRLSNLTADLMIEEKEKRERS